MQPSAEPSLYERQRLAECAPYQASFEGSINATFCVVSHETIQDSCRNALVATACRGGFSETDIIWITGKNLDADNLFTLVESVDPLCVVVLDQASATHLSRAYNKPIKLECVESLLGRPCCCFVDFARMLQIDQRKQQAWALLKETLSRLSNS